MALSTVLLVSLFVSQKAAFAGANLMVTPTRIVFEERTRTAQVTLLNTGDETGSYRISFIRQQMTETGEYVKVEENEPGQYSDPMLRYSPRQVTLQPGQPQVVRLMLRKPRTLEDGEYRSHMLFQSIPQASKSGIEAALNQNQQGISVEIIPIVGISIPVIVRHGKLEAGIVLKNAKLIPVGAVKQSPKLALEIHRSGSQSIYGDFRVIYTPKGGAESLTIGLVNGVAVYTPNTLRSFAIPLNIQQGVSLKDGRIRIIFLEPGKDEKTGLLAETEISLQ